MLQELLSDKTALNLHLTLQKRNLINSVSEQVVLEVYLEGCSSTSHFFTQEAPPCPRVIEPLGHFPSFSLLRGIFS